MDLEAIGPGIPFHDNPETKDAIIMYTHIASYPTGSLIVTRSSHMKIMYHCNDTHCHSAILAWYTYDGTDRISLEYEVGKTRPFVFEVDVYSWPLFAKFHLQLNEFGDAVRQQEWIHRPRSEVMAHPRYLTTIAKIISILPRVYINNAPHYASTYKWQSQFLTKPTENGFGDVRKIYRELEDKPLPIGLQEPRLISSTCVDMVLEFLSILHEELFVNLTDAEALCGYVKAESQIFQNTEHYDVGRLLADNSELYQMYMRDGELLLKARHTHISPPFVETITFFIPLVIGMCVGIFILFFFKPVMFSLFEKNPR